jgi:hypothetical protein
MPTLPIASEAMGDWYRAKACAIGATTLCDAGSPGGRKPG